MKQIVAILAIATALAAPSVARAQTEKGMEEFSVGASYLRTEIER